jgi:hypothetical protein
MYKLTIFIIGIFILISCSKTKEANEFQVLDSNVTGLTFSNDLVSSDTLNIFNYMYFYNGGGLGVGDFNNDGLEDIFYSANQGENKLFLNKGDLKFEDVTNEAGIKKDKTWSTGVSIVDINQDGRLDIYVM